jgi:hypothetical protein
MITSASFSPQPRRTARRAVAALLASTSLAAAAPAHATPPTTTVEQRPVHITLPACGSFALVFKADVTRKITTFCDQDGVPLRDVLVRTSEGAVSNAATGKSVPLTGVWRVTRYYTDGVLNGRVTQTSRTYAITVPGLGVIFQQTGHAIQENGQTVFEAGPHDFDNANFSELCAYLAG